MVNYNYHYHVPSYMLSFLRIFYTRSRFGSEKKKMSIFKTSSPTTKSYYKILQYFEKLVIDMFLPYKKGTDFHTAGNVCIWLFISFKTVCVVSKQIFYIWIRVVLKQFYTFDVFLWPLLLFMHFIVPMVGTSSSSMQLGCLMLSITNVLFLYL